MLSAQSPATLRHLSSPGVFMRVVASFLLRRLLPVTLSLSIGLVAGCGGGGSPVGEETDAVAWPEAPADLQASPGDASALLSFTVGTPRTDLVFLARCIAGTPLASVSMASHGTRTEQIQVTGLINGLTYACTVTATDPAGRSAGSKSVPVTPSAAAPAVQVPGAPVNVQIGRAHV